MSLKIASWRAPGSILEGSGLDFGGFWDAQVAPGWPQGFQIPRKILFKTIAFGRSNLNAKNFDFGMRAVASGHGYGRDLGGFGKDLGKVLERFGDSCQQA